MKTILSILVILSSFSAHSEEWTEWLTNKHTDPMTDEVTINLFSGKLNHPTVITNISCSPRGLGAVLSTEKMSLVQKKHHTPVKIRFDRKTPFTLTSIFVSVTKDHKMAFFTDHINVNQILDGLKTARERLVYAIDDGKAEVIPLTGLSKAMKEFEQHCPHHPKT